ncbi:MAG: SpoIIE family protein phosphatase, partial [Clostridia bacterium]|nr:SpoIIE family protein phosphatase [Clostridia bacterium]
MKTNEAAAVSRRPKKSREAALSVSAVLLWCVMGLLVPRAALYGEMAPFGIGLAAAVGGNLPVLLSLGVGYLLAAPVLWPLRYIAAVAVVGGSRWVVAALPELEERPFVPPALAFVSAALSGLVVLGQSGMDGYRVLLILVESAVAAGSAVFFRTTLEWSMDGFTQEPLALLSARQTAATLCGAVGIMAAATVEVGGFAPGRSAAALLVLVSARVGREAGGCLAGVILGAAVALSQPGQTAMAVALAFGGLLAGVFCRFGRLTMGAVFWLSAGLVTLAEVDDTMLLHMYELFAAGVLFVVLPPPAQQWLSRLFIRGGDLPAVEGVRRLMTMRLRAASAAMEEVADSLTAVTERLGRCGAPSLEELPHRCRQEVCGTCTLCALCWEREEGIVSSLGQMLPLLERQGHIEADQLTEALQQLCRHPVRLAAGLTREYQRYAAQQSAWRRLREIQGGLQGQFRSNGALLDSLVRRLEDPRQVDGELSARVMGVCYDCGLSVTDALCTREAGNRLTVDILAQDTGVRLDGGRWLKAVRAACDRDFPPPCVSEWGDGLRITLTERPRYRLECGTAQICCRGEKLCGDAAQIFSVEGRTVAVLSDGMGSGGRAAIDGTIAVGLTARLWQAGFSPASILETVNAALLVKSREETLATLDVVTVDTFTGRLDSYKAGATASLLRSGERVSRLERPSLPVGILPQVRFEHSHDRLVEGDIFLLFSDGALAGGLAAVEELLQAHPHEESMQALADRVAAAAQTAGEDHPDDITVIA